MVSHRKRVFLPAFILCALLLTLTGCQFYGGPPTPAARDDANFILFVSNQSFDLSTVDIKVEIDGVPVVNRDFNVANQHNWVEFPLKLSTGEHQMVVTSTRGQSSLTHKFSTFGKKWCVVDFWYYATEEGGAGPTPRHFGFHLFDRPPGFQ